MMGGPQCRMSILRNRSSQCHVPYFVMSLGFMSHVDFQKRPCRPVDFRGQGP